MRVYFKGFVEEVSREEAMDRVLNAPCDEIFTFSKPPYELPEHARLFRSEVCTKCGEKAREDRVRLEDGKPVCLSCFREYDR